MLSITSEIFGIVNQPEGLRDMKHRVYYATELRSYLEEFEGDLIFRGSDYANLRSLYRDNACSIVPVVIEDGCGLTLNGNLFMNEAEWRPDICEVSVQVVDAGFLSLIDNNMGIKAYVNVPRSKNDVDITDSVAVQTDLLFKSNTTGDPDATGRQGVRVYDVYKMLVAFMTDGLLGFESNYLLPDDNNPEVRIPVLITADELRNGNTDALFPYISFEDFHGDMARLYNLSFDVKDGVLRVEPDAYFKQTSAAYTIDSPTTVTQDSDVKSFYQKVKFGSQSEDSDDFTYYPNITFLGFRSEEYHLGGQCNTKSILDLEMTELITDPNVIMSNLPTASGGGTDFNGKSEDIYIVTMDFDNESVVYTNPINALEQYYNSLLTNFEVALRWGDGVPFSIFQFLGGNQNGARGYRNAIYNPTLFTVDALQRFALVYFPDRTLPEGFDTNGNMSDVSYALDSPPNVVGNTGTDTQLKTIYTAPVASIYTAIARVRYTNSQAFAGDLFISRYAPATSQNSIDALGGSGGSPEAFVNGAYERNISWTTYMDAGDRLAVGIGNISEVIQDSFFQVNDLDFIEKTYDPEENYLIKTSFDYPLTSQDWQDFLDNRYGEVTVNHANGQIVGFLNDVTRRLEDGITEWSIKSTFENS